MPNYDFHSLSPLDFEELARNLVQAESSIRFESFGPGRDGGIDFRHATSTSGAIVLQCKHYPSTPKATLLRDLRTKEVPKTQRVKPTRYILAVSVSLTPQEKQKIMLWFSPYTRQPKDIYTREDLNNLLGLYPAIEKQTFKLWLHSVRQLEEMLATKTRNLSQQTLQRIEIHARRFVQNDSYADAIAILERYNYCIIAGIPGIGKTTLADLLVLQYAASGYEIVIISEDISEAYAYDVGAARRLFYYDDFLGQTTIADKFGKNEDKRLVEFIESVQRSNVAKLILTTREYVLSQAQRTYERLARASLDNQMCIVDLGKYTRIMKARILFNHLYYSAMPSGRREALLGQNFLLRVVDHPNFNPRVVDLMTSWERWSELSDDEY